MTAAHIDSTALNSILKFVQELLVSTGYEDAAQPDDSFLDDLALSSMQLFRLSAFVEEHFRITLDAGDIVPENFASANSLAAFVTRNIPRRASA